MGSKDGGSSTVQNTDPWVGQQPYLTRGFELASQNLNRGFYPGTTYTPFSTQTETALSRMGDLSASNPISGGLGSFVSNRLGQAPSAQGARDLVSRGTSGVGRQGALDFLRSGVGGLPQTAFSALSGAAGYAPDTSGLNYTSGLPTESRAALSGLAAGGTNPFLDAMFQRGTRAIGDRFNQITAPSINATFGAAGRTGSPLHGQVFADAAGEIGDALSDFGTGLYGGQYQQDQNRRLGAAQALGGLGLSDEAQRVNAAQAAQQLGLAGVGARTGAASALGGLGLNQRGQDIGLTQTALNQGNVDASRALSGAGILSGLYGQDLSTQLGAAGLAPTANQMQYGDIDQQLRAGGLVEGKAREVIDDAMMRWNFPRQQLADYISAIQGNYGGTTATNTEVPRNRTAGILGGGLVGSQIGGALGERYPNSNAGLWGTILGGLLGGI